jgi:hypothetical protein
LSLTFPFHFSRLGRTTLADPPNEYKNATRPAVIGHFRQRRQGQHQPVAHLRRQSTAAGSGRHPSSQDSVFHERFRSASLPQVQLVECDDMESSSSNPKTLAVFHHNRGAFPIIDNPRLILLSLVFSLYIQGIL